MVTFLWRAKGEPEPASLESPFEDVKNANAYYFKAVLWAVEQKITNGVDDTHFGPDKGCTRGQVVTFLWRAEGEPAPANTENPFTDVKVGEYYGQAVLWAVNHEPQITNGTSGTTFSPNKTCTRGQIVTFLYRALAAAEEEETPDKDELDAAVTEAQEAYDEALYTAASWEAFQTALANANAVLADPEATQEEIDAALEALEAAIAALEEAAPQVSGELVYGNTGELGGHLCYGWFNDNAYDGIIRNLIDDYDVITLAQGGKYVVNDSIVEAIESENNEDGSKTYTVTVRKDLHYNNGDPVTAADFVAYALVNASPAAKEAGASAMCGMIVGANDYRNGDTNVFSGLRLLDAYTYAITIDGAYLPYFYELTYASLRPLPLKQFASAPLVVKDDGKGAYLDGGELKAEEILANDTLNENRISAGPYTLTDLDLEAQTATLKVNPNYAGNFEGRKPAIETIRIVPVSYESMLEDLRTGRIDVLTSLSESSEIWTAMNMEGVRTNLYQRNGYGKVTFQCDFGPTQFKAVRHAVANLLDRNEFANEFCDGYGTVVDGPYSPSMWMYTASAEELAQRLNSYACSLDSAVKELEEDGWVLDGNGDPYTSGLRYKEVTAEQAGNYKHVIRLSDGRLLMPLIIEWACTYNNMVSDLLNEMLVEGELTAAAGMEIRRTEMGFMDMLNYMYRDTNEGEQYGIPTYGMYNLATNYGAAYDMSHNYVMPGTAEYDDGYNINYCNDKTLDDLSMQMVYDVEPGDNESFRKIWVDFVDEWNEFLPDLPLYSNQYCDAVRERVENLVCDSLWDFPSAVLYASVK